MAAARPKVITFVTANEGKRNEFQQILGSDIVELKNQSIPLPEIQGTLEEIALAKCKTAMEFINGPVIIEDSGLGFHAMSKSCTSHCSNWYAEDEKKGYCLPGPYIKWFQDAVGNPGLVAMLQGFANKGATATCIVSLSIGPGHEPIMFKSEVTGTVVEPRGLDIKGQFGWDPIFQPDTFEETFAELTALYGKFNVKNIVSPRYLALQKLGHYLRTGEIVP